MGLTLTPYERETVVNMNDEDDFAIISTYQRPLITRLRKNPAAEETTSPAMARYGGASFTLPARLVTIRSPRVLSERQRTALAANAAKAREGRRTAQNAKAA